MKTGNCISGQCDGSGAVGVGSSPASLMDKKRMSGLDRKCSKAQNVFFPWRKYTLDPMKWPGSMVKKAKAEFEKADAQRKKLRHKMKGVKPRGEQ